MRPHHRVGGISSNQASSLVSPFCLLSTEYPNDADRVIYVRTAPEWVVQPSLSELRSGFLILLGEIESENRKMGELCVLVLLDSQMRIHNHVAAVFGED